MAERTIYRAIERLWQTVYADDKRIEAFISTDITNAMLEMQNIDVNTQIISKMTKHFIEFYYPGSFFPETSVEEITSREDTVKCPRGCY